MNLNIMAAQITRAEGKKKSLSIGQVKEVIGLMADYRLINPEDFDKTMHRLGRRREREGRTKIKGTRKIL